MPEPLKDRINIELLTPIVTFIKQLEPSFNPQNFMQLTFNNEWNNLELKQRFRKISESFKTCLPQNYPTAVNILAQASQKFTGFESLFFPDFIEAYGWQDKKNYTASMQAIAQMTSGSSAEFAIRPFIENDPTQTFLQLYQWAESDNEHVRRLASEGSRPKLPWASHLKKLIKDPTPTIKILEILKCDKSKYVQKSVANHLNDISKDHPDLVLDLVKTWQGLSPQTDWIIKHACRTLLKEAHPQALVLFGYANASTIQVNHFECDEIVKKGEKLNFSFSLKDLKSLGKIRIEYAIYFMKANGKQNKKIFKIGESNYKEQQKEIQKHYSFKAISTRKYYTGEHQLAILINGQKKALKCFLLV